jgi:hypothetical protein
MASFELFGTLKQKTETQVVSDKFSKRDFILTTDTATQYPQFISLQVTQDKCGLLDQFQVGEELKVSFNLRGREWNGPQGVKYFNTLEAWRIERASAAAPTPQAQPSHVAAPPTASTGGSTVISSNEVADDLPF